MAKKIDPKKFYLSIIESKKNDELTQEAIQYFYILVENIGNMLKYERAEDKEDCAQTALLDCFAGWRRFDPSITTNAFSFFTQVVKNGYVKGWKILYPTKKKGTIRLNGGNHDDCTGIYSL